MNVAWGVEGYYTGKICGEGGGGLHSCGEEMRSEQEMLFIFIL